MKTIKAYKNHKDLFFVDPEEEDELKIMMPDIEFCFDIPVKYGHVSQIKDKLQDGVCPKIGEMLISRTHRMIERRKYYIIEVLAGLEELK